METKSKRNVKMSKWIFLSKGAEDDYINQFAAGCGERPIDPVRFNFEESSNPIVLRGILKKRIIKKCISIFINKK